MALPLIIILCFLGSYALVIFLISSGVRRSELPAGGEKENTRKVSIIIPFRNETHSLPRLVADLLAQSYPKKLFEVVFVDDHSEDGSRTMVDSMISGEQGFRCLPLPPDSTGKKAALFHGIQHASFEYLIQVDADCRIGAQFIASHMAFLEKHPADLVAGLVSTSNGAGGFLEAFERLDLLALAGCGVGSFALGRPMMCSGANLVYSRELYMATRSFDPVQATESGDDMFLMIGARKLNRTLAYNTSPEAFVETEPASSLPRLLAQRIRWGAKTTHYGMLDIQLLALLVTLSNVAVFLMPLWLFLYTGAWPWLAGAILLKSLADFALLCRITVLSQQRSSLRWFAPVMLAYYPVFLMTLLGVLLGKSRWKRDG